MSLAIGFIAVVVLFDGLYLHFSWKRHERTFSSEAIMLAQSVESLLHTEHIARLGGGEEDLKTVEYGLIKRAFVSLVRTENPIRFAYLLRLKGEKVIILVDSESPYSPDYSPPGQVYEEADPIYKEVFKTKRVTLTHPVTDRWGTWISALVPIRNSEADTVVAVLGIDYAASEWTARLWQRMVPDIFISISVFMLSLAWLGARIRQGRLQDLSKRLAVNEALYRSIFENAPIGIAMAKDRSILFRSALGHRSVNPMFERILRRFKGEEDAVDMTSITHPEDIEIDAALYRQFKEGSIPGYSVEKRFLRPEGTSVWTQMTVSRLLGLPQDDAVYLCLLEDITARKSMEESLLESERSKAVLLSNLPGMAYRCENDEEWTMRYVSAGCAELTGYPPEELVDNKVVSFNDLITPEYREVLRSKWVSILAERKPFRHEYEINTAAGKRKWVLEVGQGIFNKDGRVDALEGIILDITERKRSEDALAYASGHDPLTGLENLNSLKGLLGGREGERDKAEIGLVCVNLSAIHGLSLRYGFKHGEDLVRNIANVLSVLCSGKIRLFHINQYKFAYHIEGYKDRSVLETFCESLSQTLGELLDMERIAVGIGVVEVGESERIDPEHLLKILHIASEKNLDSARNDIIVSFYDDKMENDLVREEAISRELADIASGLGIDRLYLQYQPILDLRTNRICSFEALARLKSNSFGPISPLEFIALAEKDKLIIPLGDKLFLQALSFQRCLKEKGYGKLSVAVNISAIQLLREGFADNICSMLEEKNADPDSITLEITESIFAENMHEVNKILESLKGCGIKIALDDFGKEYSSLAREREMNIDFVKIDKYFIDKLLEIDPEKAITSDIISIGHKMQHCVVAEGVEEERQLEYLRAHGCDRAQGYLISRPLDKDAALEFLAKWDDIELLNIPK
jgi:PAS domain S-box-containing protein